MPRLVFKRSLIFLLAVRRDVRELDQISARTSSMKLPRRIAVVTGAGSRIGRATVQLFGARARACRRWT